jgi:YidC/Oxa1 family membrane protein insertase
MVWDGWQRHKHPAPVQAAAQQPGQPVAAAGQSPKFEGLKKADAVSVKTDIFAAEISTAGGDLRRVELLQHHDAKDKNKPFVLLEENGSHVYVAQTGLLGNDLPTHNSVFTAEQTSYTLEEGKDSVTVKLTSDMPFAKVSKLYTFHRGSYLIDIGYEVENIGATPLSPSVYFQLVRDNSQPDTDMKFVPTYTGPAVYTEQEKFQKVEFSDIEKNKAKFVKNADNGWAGMLQHYFVSAWLPKQKTPREYFTKNLGNNLYSVGLISALGTIQPGQKISFSNQLYSGPAQSKLDEVAPGLGLTVDYGWVTVIATPLFWLLTILQGMVHNWGVAVIVLTILIKLAFFPLSAASYRSMAKMRSAAPKMEKIKKLYGDDRERLHKEMMELYKTEKINPLGGCLPVLIQIPVFIALYWAILSSVEMRHAPFFGWISDLSAADPYYVLPLIMGLSMIVQTRLNPTPPDPMQAKVMQIMPIVFSVVFFFFPAGLVLYSIVNNLLSIAQQWYITKSIETAPKGAA